MERDFFLLTLHVPRTTLTPPAPNPISVQVPPRNTSSPGFTLIEAGLATVIVGVGFTALMGLFAACTQQNRAASHLTTATLLAGNVQEMMAELPFSEPKALVATFGPEPGETLATFDDVDDLNGASINPPVDALRRPLGDLSQYTQAVSVETVEAGRVTRGSSAGDAVRVTVKVLYGSGSDAPQPLYELSWVRFRQK